MSWAHLKTFLWLRQRLTANRTRRAGSVAVIVRHLFQTLAVLLAMAALATGFLVGLRVLPPASEPVFLLVWDGLVIAFLVFWLAELMSEVQRSDMLSLEHFLHLPVSPTGAFLINYVGSSFSFGLLLFLPAMFGMSIGLAFSKGAAMLVLVPMVAAFFLMITAVTHQFRGWLASMMTSPRRRQTVVGIMTVAFTLTLLLPQFLDRNRREREREVGEVVAELDRDLAAGRITRAEYEERSPSGVAARVLGGASSDLLHVVLPPGWLPYGASAASDGRLWGPVAAILGMTFIGVLSLRRSYQTTLRMYMGSFGSRSRRRARKTTGPSSTYPAAFLEKKFPWISEHASAVAAAGLRSLLRANEIRMMLLTPVIMLIVMSGILAGLDAQVPELVRPLMAISAAAFMLSMSMVGFLGNAFAYDRGGFRAFVLGPVRRHDVLLGKNLSMLPFGLGIMTLAVGLSQWFVPMRLDHAIAVMVQTVPMFLVYCMVGNVISIFVPIVIRPGSGMPAPHQGIKVLIQIAFMFIFPAALVLTLIPLGVEFLLSLIASDLVIPAFLVLGLVQVAVTLSVYAVALKAQGNLLYDREQRILEVVAAKAE